MFGLIGFDLSKAIQRNQHIIFTITWQILVRPHYEKFYVASLRTGQEHPSKERPKKM